MSSKKDENYAKILNAAIALDFRKGHQKWTLSELSRSTGVTRSLIYYYFGKDRLSLLHEAIRHLGEECFGLSPERLELWKKGQVAEAVIATRTSMQNTPALAAFYLAHRSKPTELGALMQKLERDYEKKLKSFFPAFDRDQVLALFGVFFGLAFAPGISERSVREAVRVILQCPSSAIAN